MLELIHKAGQIIFSKIMKHPCIFGVICAFGATLLCWTISQYTTLATPVFPRHQVRIFPLKSYVTDIYNGSLETLDKLLQRNDLRFVAFYAPWCAQSRKMVPKVAEAAKKLRDKIGFIAINCWIGTCKSNFPLREYPKFFVYHTKYPPVEFLEPPDSWRIIRFLKSVTRPFHYLGNEQHFKKLIASHEAVVVGYFNVQKKSNKRFSIFLKLCISSVNRVSKTLYGIVTNSKMAALAGLQKYGQIILHQILGDKQYFPDKSNYTADSIIQWIIHHQAEIVIQLTPNMTYLDHYITQLKRGPAVLLFLSFRPHLRNYSTELLQQYRIAATTYSDCRALDSTKHIERSSKARHSSFDAKQLASSETGCKYPCRLCMTIPQVHSKNTCSICQTCTRKKCCNKNQLNTYTKKELFPEMGRQFRDICWSLPRKNYYRSEVVSCCCAKHERAENDGVDVLKTATEELRMKYQTRKLLFDTEIEKLTIKNSTDMIFQNAFKLLLKTVDNLSKIDAASSAGSSRYNKLLQRKMADNSRSQNLDVTISEQLRRRDILRRLQEISHSHEDAHAAKDESYDAEMAAKIPVYSQQHAEKLKHHNFSISDFDGLRCKTNRTVNYFYLDVDIHGSMVKHLGINQTSVQKLTSLVLLDLKQEATYILKETIPVTRNTVVEFVTNFTNGRLDRRLRSAKSTNVCSETSNSSCIFEATTNTFQEVVLDDAKDVLLMYYAPWCGFCKQGYRVLLQLAIAYSGINSLRFARINADENDLPYHYAVDGYPSFILFPRGRKSFSQSYPDVLPVKFKEMRQFLQKHCSKNTRRTIKLRNSAIR